MNDIEPNARLELGCSCCGGLPHLGASQPRTGLSRRGLFRGTLGGLAATAAMGTMLPRRAAAQTDLSPDAALQALMDGNKRFTAQKLTSLDEDLAILKAHTVEKQEPFAAVLGCADSRVPVELVFDQTIGRLFVARVAGNIAFPSMIASLEYGAAVLGTKVIMVLGHGNCGAVSAAMSGRAVPGQISSLYAPLQPAVKAGKGNLEETIKANARIQARLLETASPVLAGLVKKGDLKVVAGYYALDNGTVTIL